MFLTSCHSLKYLGWCVSPVLSSVNNLQVSSLPPVPFWRRKTVTMKVLICVRCASPVAGDTSLSRASHSPVTSLPSVPRLRHSGKSYGCVWCVSPALEAGNPRSSGSPDSAWRLLVSSMNLLFIFMFAMGSIVYKISLATEENVFGCCYLAGKPPEELLPADQSQTQHTCRYLRSLKLEIQTMVLL